METPAAPDPAATVDYWRKRAIKAERELEKGEERDTAAEVLCDLASSLAPKTYEAAPPLLTVPKGDNSPQSAVLMLSDTHVGQVITPEQTLGMGRYNFELFLRRLARLERSVQSILRDHTTTEVRKIHLCMLGDMLHGNLIHSIEAGQHNTLFEQFFSAGHALAQFIRGLTQLAPVEVHTAVGNHTRWGTQKKMPTDNTYSNMDQFLYAYVAALIPSQERLAWHLDRQPFCRFDVEGFRFLGTHGTHLRGGDRILGIPAHAIGRNISTHAQLAAKNGEPLPNYYLVGHLHRPVELPHTLGEFIVNGAFAGMDGFGLMEAFNSANPLQKFFLVHKKFGRSAEYNLRLDLGDETPHHYNLPEDFQCK